MNPVEERIEKAFRQAGACENTITLSYAEKIVGLCRIKGLTCEDVIQGKTPNGIASLWMHRRLNSDCNHDSSLSLPLGGGLERGYTFPLLPFSKIVHDTMLRNSAAEKTWTFPILLRTKDTEIEEKKLAEALETAIANHPVFSMRITKDGRQIYEKGYRTPYLKWKVYSEAGYVYLSLSINRILGDATSFVVFAQNIWRAYRGEKLPPDNYLQYLQQYEETKQSKEYKECGEILKQQFGEPDYPLRPEPDSPEGTLSPSESYTPLIIYPDYADKLAAFSRKHNISINELFCTVTALAIMDYNGTDKAGLTWAYMGRETKDQMTIFGSLHRDIPYTLSAPLQTSPEGEALERVNVCCETWRGDYLPKASPMGGGWREPGGWRGPLYSIYPFTLLSPPDSPWHTAVNVLVQPSIAEAMEGCPAEFEFIPQERNSDSYCMLDIDITTAPLTLTINYSPKHYTKESIDKFARLIENNINIILNQ